MASSMPCLLYTSADGADGVIVAGDGIVDLVGIAVGIGDGHNGDAQTMGLGDGDVYKRQVLICTRQRKTAAPAARKGMRHDEVALQQQHDDDHDAHVRHVHALL